MHFLIRETLSFNLMYVTACYPVGTTISKTSPLFTALLQHYMFRSGTPEGSRKSGIEPATPGLQIKSNRINFIGIKSSHRTVTSHMYTVSQEQSQT